MELIDVGYVPTLSYDLIALAKTVEAGHKYSDDDSGLTVHLKSGEDLLCPVVGDMYISYGGRVDGDGHRTCPRRSCHRASAHHRCGY